MAILSVLKSPVWGPPQLNSDNFCQDELASATEDRDRVNHQATPAVNHGDGADNDVDHEYEILARPPTSSEETTRGVVPTGGGPGTTATSVIALGVPRDLTSDALKDHKREQHELYHTKISEWVAAVGSPIGGRYAAQEDTLSPSDSVVVVDRPGPSSSCYFSDGSAGFAPATTSDAVALDIRCAGAKFNDQPAAPHIYDLSLSIEAIPKRNLGLGSKVGKGHK